MFVEATDVLKWKPVRGPHPELPCALCGRKLGKDEECLSAVWRAQGGQYVQAYHVSCAYIVKAWGIPDKYRTPRENERWAWSLSCAGCKDRALCSLYVFSCSKAVDAIRLLGWSKQDGEEIDLSELERMPKEGRHVREVIEVE